MSAQVAAPDRIDDLTLATYLWADEDFTALSSPQRALFSWSTEATTNPTVSLSRFNKAQYGGHHQPDCVALALPQGAGDGFI
eukprot:3520694-Pyramimonas_sp.AAC.1